MRFGSVILIPFLVTASLLAGCADKSSGVVEETPVSSQAGQSSSSRTVKDYTQARLMNTQLGHGLNMGNCLDGYPDEGSWGCTIQQDYFAKIKAAGFQSVRIPVRWSNKTLPDGTIDPVFKARVLQIVQWAAAAGLVSIVNIHHFDELTGVRDSTVIYNPNDTIHVPFNFDGQVVKFYSMWAEIAALLSVIPDNQLVLELLNEPQKQVNAIIYNTLAENVIPIIRATNPTRTLMTGVTSYGKWGGAQSLKLPENESNIILSIHYYDPMNVTHQGTNFSGPAYPTGVPWGNKTELNAQNALFKRIADSSNVLFPSTDGKGIPIHVGEFGIHTSADMTTRVAWTRAVRDNCDKNGFSYAYWEFNNQFGIADREGNFYPEMLGALVGP